MHKQDSPCSSEGARIAVVITNRHVSDRSKDRKKRTCYRSTVHRRRRILSITVGSSSGVIGTAVSTLGFASLVVLLPPGVVVIIIVITPTTTRTLATVKLGFTVRGGTLLEPKTPLTYIAP